MSGVLGPVAPGLPTAKMRKWRQVLHRASLTWSNSPVGAAAHSVVFYCPWLSLVGHRSPGAFGSRIPLRRKGSRQLLFQHALSEEGQPCKSPSLAKWFREFWGTEPARVARGGRSFIQSMGMTWEG